MILKAPRYFLEEIVAPACNNDKNIIQAFADIPIALFVDEGMKVKAYEDKALPIGMGQTISQVTTVANMLYMLELEKNNNVLEIGSGSCRSKADSRNHERNPLTEKGNFNIENNTAGSVGAYIDI